MRSAVLALLTPLALAGCNEAPHEPITVDQARENIHAWNGRMVAVQGWLGNCEGLDCAIYPSLAEAKSVANDNPKSPQWKAAMNHRLSIGTAYDFDEQAAPLQFKQVTIGAFLSDMCRGWNGACFDRAPDIVPLSITPIQPITKAD